MKLRRYEIDQYYKEIGSIIVMHWVMEGSPSILFIFALLLN
jgi:hypothetical protein